MPFALFLFSISRAHHNLKKMSNREVNYRELIEQTQTIIWEVDASGLYTYVSPQAKTIWGDSPDDLVGKKHFYDLHPIRGREEFKQAALSVFERQESFRNLLNPIVTQQGRIIWVETNGVPILDNHQNLVGYRGSDNDVTDRVIAEEQLKNQNEHLSAIITTIPDLLFVIDLEGNLKEFHHSSASEKELLIPANQVAGTNVKSIFDEVTSNLHIQKVRECIKKNEVVTYEYTVSSVDGNIHHFEARLAALGGISVMAFVRDITEKKLADALILEKNRELAEMNAAKDKFFSIISHDLKNPFNSLIGFSELLVKGFHKYSPEEIQRNIKIIYDVSHKTYKLLETLLEWSRAQSGKIDFNPQYLSLNDLISATISLVNDMAEAKNISITSHISDHLIIYADSNIISTVLRNLITNSIKFTNRNGSITINVKHSGPEIGISVIDTGIGMKEDLINRLFRMTEKVNSNGTENEKGSGVGLLLCKELLSRHSGKISVESEPGKGSEFKFTLPATPASLINRY